MDKDTRDIHLVTSTKATFRMEKLMEEASMNGETEKYMMVNGLME